MVRSSPTQILPGVQRTVACFIGLICIACGDSLSLSESEFEQPDQDDLTVLEDSLSRLPANTVLVATFDGDTVIIIETISLTEEEVSNFSSFDAWLQARQEAIGCQVLSTVCVLCPSGKIYCTNASNWTLDLSLSYRDSSAPTP